MRRVIFKYQLGKEEESYGKHNIAMPKGATVLSVVNQNEHMVVYALANNNEERGETHIFKVFATGIPTTYERAFKFLGTVIFYDGAKVYHVFHKKESKLFRAKEFLRRIFS